MGDHRSQDSVKILLRRAFAAFGSIRARLARRPDSEHEMAVNRIVIASIFMFGAWAFDREGADFMLATSLAVYVAYCAAALGIITLIVVWPGAVRARRIATMALDLGAGTFASHIAGPAGIGFLYPCYLLIIYGYGFRYGANWLILSSAGSFASLAMVAAFSPHWDKQQAMIGGLLIGLLIIPAYAYNLVRKLWAAKSQAEASNRAKSLFVASVSHDLRTPLNAIIGLGDLLASSKIPPEEVEMARMIGGAGRSLLGLIDSILDLSQLETARRDIKQAPLDLHAALREACELLSVSAEAKGLCLTLRAQTALPRWIVSSDRHIRDSLNNLVGNAIKFTEAGRVDVNVSCRETIDGRVRLRFEVQDTGIGVSDAAQERIFDQFTQANENIRDHYGGSGLGLAIVRQLVSALDGQLGVASAEGRGSVFWFEIEAPPAPVQRPAPAGAAPTLVVYSCDQSLVALAKAIAADVRAVARAEDLADAIAAVGGPFALVIDHDLAAAATEPLVAGAAQQAALRRAGVVLAHAHDGISKFPPPLAPFVAELARRDDAGALAEAVAFVVGPSAGETAAPAAQPDPQQPCAVLVAEDNRTNQKVIEKMLTRAGHRVTIAANGDAALELLARERFDIVFMDINMPVVDGVEATRRLRARETHGERTPVIALTADVTLETRERCAAAGMDGCLTKPVEMKDLLAFVGRWATANDAQASERGTAPDALPADRRPSVNARALGDLESLGGRDFVCEIAQQFVADAVAILAALTAAARENDVLRFRDEAHALRSCSANIGASNIYELCLSWREVGAREFAANGAAYIAELEREFDRVRADLAPYLSQAA